MLLFYLLFTVHYLLLLSGCQKAEEPAPIKKEIKIAAIVNDEKITVDEFEREFSVLRKKHSVDETAEKEQLKTAKESLLNQLIEKRLLLHEAEKLNLSVTDAELDNIIKKMTAYHPPEFLQEILKKEEISMGEWRAKISENILIEKFITHKLRGSIDITDKDIDAYFKSNLKNLTKPLQVHVFQIVVRSEEEALKIRAELLKGEDFSIIAMEKSIGHEAEKGGDLGFFSEGQMPQEFDTVFKMKSGEISYPVKTQYGYHIFKLIERREPQKLDPLKEKEKIKNLIMKERYDEAFKKMVNSLRDAAKIEIKEIL